VQVFARTGQNTRLYGSWDEEDMNGYQVINEVGSGGTLSSLFSILSLFTDEVKLSWQNDSRDPPIPKSSERMTPPRRTKTGRTNSDVSQSLEADLERASLHGRGRGESVSSSGSTAHPLEMMSPPTDRASPSRLDRPFRPTASDAHSFVPSESTPRSQFHHGIIGRATEDSTLAVIPAEAFRRVTKKFPKATSHIVQGMSIR